MTVELIGQILLQDAGLNAAALDSALACQREEMPRRRLGRILAERNAVTEEAVLRALARQWGLPYLSEAPPDRLDRNLVLSLPPEFLKKRCALPLTEAGGRATLVMTDPLDVQTFDAVAAVIGRPCERAVALPSVIQEALTRCFYHEGDTSAEILDELNDADGLARPATAVEAEDLMDVSDRAPIIKLINTIFYQAVRARASDIHIEPYEKTVKVRFRIDGVLHDRFTPPKPYVAALVSRLKIMARLNIAERRLPQDGRSRIKIGDTEIDIRVSTIPTSGGERVVLRLLDKAGGRFAVSDLGFAPDNEKRFRRLIETPHGVFLLTGPTGSGKTTTLYAALTEMNTEDRNILTVEDPIEYQLPGVGQMQVQPRIGLTFANSLRHILRQDPDVIMVGEVRDQETAEIVIQSALTGHLVLSTLHTNDSASAFTRLLDMGIEPYLVSSAVIAVMAQRLVRVICSRCKTESPLGPDALAALSGRSDLAARVIYRGAGCEYCLSTGYRGRTGIFELLTVNDETREQVMQRAGANTIKQAGVRHGMATLREDGLRKVLAGETTIEEVLRVTQDELTDGG